MNTNETGMIFPKQQLCQVMGAYLGVVFILGSILFAVMLTASLHFEKYIILRSKGRWFFRLLIVCPVLELIFGGFTVISGCVDDEWLADSPQILAAEILENMNIFMLLGILTSRQMILCKIFQTDKKTPVFDSKEPPSFLIIPISFALLDIIPELLYALSELDIVSSNLNTGVQILFILGFLGVYCYYALLNRKIPLRQYCDFNMNVGCLVFFIIYTITVSVAIGMVPNWFPEYYTSTLANSFRSTCFCFCVFLVCILLFAREAFAIWFHQKAVLDDWEHKHRNGLVFPRTKDKNNLMASINNTATTATVHMSGRSNSQNFTEAHE